jgi:hypothetical protein
MGGYRLVGSGVNRWEGRRRLRTETEAITRALDSVIEMAHFQAEVEAGLDILVDAGGFVDALGTA